VQLQPLPELGFLHSRHCAWVSPSRSQYCQSSRAR
jgi:hypothetical protein